MKIVMWLVIGLVLFFAGWLLKDQAASKDFGRSFMSMGFLIVGTVIAVSIIKDVHKKKE